MYLRFVYKPQMPGIPAQAGIHAQPKAKREFPPHTFAGAGSARQWRAFVFFYETEINQRFSRYFPSPAPL